MEYQDLYDAERRPLNRIYIRGAEFANEMRKHLLTSGALQVEETRVQVLN